MFTVKKLKDMPYAQAHVEITDNGVCLFSYVTLVATLEDGWLTITGLYSRTTRKHIAAFMREYTELDYQTAKHLSESGYKMNVLTGEIVKLVEI